MKYAQCISAWLVLFLMMGQVATAQYFGKNKPSYREFDFEVLETPHFDIYHYLENDTALHKIANWSEQWHHIHQSVLQDTFGGKNPMILYNNHGDFQQTNTINGAVGVGTGGVTEAFKNRVIYPFAMSNQQTHHVLGHELVHAFQYEMILRGDSTSIRNLANLPLWMVEGLAEYLSIGRVDPHTAMWMRDAVLQDDVPSIKQLNNPKYFPYRYGQTFWAFVTGLGGDQIIRDYFVNTAKYGLERATPMTFGITLDKLSELWEETLKNQYQPYLRDQKRASVGKAIVSKENSGRMNISPAISPNGRYVIYLSEINLFTMDLFLADARSGEIIRTVASTAKDGHIDDYNYIESSGTWSPDSKQFAFVAFKKGKNILLIKDVNNGKTVDELAIKGVPAFSSPAWSPDGKSIVVSGLVQGQVDLYQVNLKDGKVSQLTDDEYTEMIPDWSADGQRILFSTDRLAMRKGSRRAGKLPFNLAILNTENGKVANLDIFPGADNLNPVFDPEGNILFLSNRDGFRNMYKYETTTGKVFQLTDLLTGISGITHFAPAISVTKTERRNRIVYSHYWANGYDIYRADTDQFLNQEVDASEVDMTPAILPTVDPNAGIVVEQNLALMNDLPPLNQEVMQERDYQPRFKLDYVGGSVSGGVGTSNTFGTVSGAAGGVDFLFSDILGNHQLFTSVALNGEIFDFGGVAAYINRKNRWNWGVSFSHIPFRSPGQFRYLGVDTLQVSNDLGIVTGHYALDQIRTFEDKISAFVQLPFSKTLRAEGGLSYSFYNNRVDRFDNYYDGFGNLVFQEREKISAEEAGYRLFDGQLAVANAALVGDNSYFGLAAPLQGTRYRFGVDAYFGSLNFYNITADFRKYIRLQPVTFAFRVMHTGRYGDDANQLPSQFLGFPWFMRGFGFNTAEEVLVQNDRSVNDLIGSKLAVANFEIRIPFTGPKQLALINSKFLFSDLNFFVDGGITWDELEQFKAPDGPLSRNTAKPLFSAGASMRVNLFGAVILEPFYAIPLLKETSGTFGINIIPGW